MMFASPIPVRLVSHNIRYATTAPFKGEEPWVTRCPRLCNTLTFSARYCAETFLCLQEVLHGQLRDICAALNASPASRDGAPDGSSAAAAAEWAYVGVGRDDGRRAGEYSPILYRRGVWAVEEAQTIWLSETPDQPSRGWDAASVRILTVGVFAHRASGRRVVALNTHLDDQGARARVEAARMILAAAARFSAPQQPRRPLPVFLAGDLNSEEGGEAYRRLNDKERSLLRDSRELVAPEGRYGNENTFTGFGHETDDPPKRIDFVFLGPRTAVRGRRGEPAQEAAEEEALPLWEVAAYGVLPNRFDDLVYSSDHRAVVTDVLLL